MTAGGSRVSGSAVDIVAQIVQNEIGGSYPDEAIKAQAVAAYSYVKFYNNSGTSPSVGLSTPGTRVKNLVAEVIGQTVQYNGSICLATYGAYNSGNSASSQNVWGTRYAYLQSVYCPYDAEYNGEGRTTTISASSVKSKLESKLKVTLGSDKDSWFEIISYYDTDYVDKVLIDGSVTTTGRNLRESVLGTTTLRSVAFEVYYDADGDKFVFTTWGYGHGVGLSQVGAKLMADDGYNYIEILESYYPGAEVV